MSNVTSPSTAQLVAPFVGGIAVIALTATLSGCSALMDSLNKVHSESFDSYAAAERDWVGVAVPSWIPSDATGLRNYATLDETNAVIAVTTSSAPIGCEPGARETVPFQLPEWAPRSAVTDQNGTFVDTVLLCGDYEVVPSDDGLIGWFSARESGQTPASPGAES